MKLWNNHACVCHLYSLQHPEKYQYFLICSGRDGGAVASVTDVIKKRYCVSAVCVHLINGSPVENFGGQAAVRGPFVAPGLTLCGPPHHNSRMNKVNQGKIGTFNLKSNYKNVRFNTKWQSFPNFLLCFCCHGNYSLTCTLKYTLLHPNLLLFVLLKLG